MHTLWINKMAYHVMKYHDLPKEKNTFTSKNILLK